MNPLRVYVDASVFGGCIDEEFEAHSCRFFDLVRAGRIVVLVSEVVIEELAGSPAPVRAVLESLNPDNLGAVELTSEVIDLREAYIAAGIIGRRWLDDATHVAAATIARADAIVSWNFRHIVRLDKMRAYNRVNLERGFGLLSIVSPQEIRLDEADEEQEDV